MYFFANVTAKTFELNMPQAQQNPLLQRFQNSSLVVLGQYIFKAWCSFRNDKCKVNKGPNSKMSAMAHHQREYKVMTIHSGSWWGIPIIALADYGAAKKLYIFIAFLIFFLILKNKNCPGVEGKGRELNTVKLSLLMHRITGVVINMQYVER